MCRKGGYPILAQGKGAEGVVAALEREEFNRESVHY
jgi:hypothetical protein